MSDEAVRYQAYELCDLQGRGVEHWPAPGCEVVKASDYDAIVRALKAELNEWYGKYEEWVRERARLYKEADIQETYPAYKREKVLRCKAEQERDTLQERLQAHLKRNETTVSYVRQMLMLPEDCDADTFFDTFKQVYDGWCDSLTLKRERDALRAAAECQERRDDKIIKDLQRRLAVAEQALEGAQIYVQQSDTEREQATAANTRLRDAAENVVSTWPRMDESQFRVAMERLQRSLAPACPACYGTGRTDNHVTGEVECDHCEGTGEAPAEA